MHIATQDTVHIVRKVREGGRGKREVFTINKSMVAMSVMTGRAMATFSSLT